MYTQSRSHVSFYNKLVGHCALLGIQVVVCWGSVYVYKFRPCQSSSQAGKRRGRRDPRGGKVLAKGLEMIAHAQPLICILENVRGLLSVDGGGYFRWIQRRLKAIGYPQFKYKVLGSHQFSLPQQRQRLFMVALRTDIGDADFRFPVGDETRTPTLSQFLKKRLAKKYANTIRCGGRGSKDRHAWDMIKRADGSWYQLTVADCKALMGLPPQFAMPVPITQQFRLLGNAITIEPARSIMRECKRVVLAAHGLKV